MKVITFVPVDAGLEVINEVTSDDVYTVRNVPNGTYDLIVETDGYDTVQRRLYINGNTRIQIPLNSGEVLVQNLLTPDMMSFRWGAEKYEDGEQADDPTNFDRTSNVQIHTWDLLGGYRINSQALRANNDYTLVIEYQKDSGTLTHMGGEAEFIWQDNTVFIDDVEQSEPWNNGNAFEVSDDTDKHLIKIHVTVPDYDEDREMIQIQPNYQNFQSVVLTFSTALYDGHF